MKKPGTHSADVGLNIAAARVRCGLTKQALAERVKRDPSRISRIEAGDANITVDDLYEFAAALDTTPAQLLQGGDRA